MSLVVIMNCHLCWQLHRLPTTFWPWNHKFSFYHGFKSFMYYQYGSIFFTWIISLFAHCACRTLIVVIVIFVITMIKKQVSDYVEEWIHKILVYLCIQFLPVALETLLYRCIDWVLVVCETIYDLCIDFLSKVFKQR